MGKLQVNNIIYVGGFRLPDKNGSAIRVNDIAKLLSKLDYVIHIGGLLSEEPSDTEKIKYWDYSLCNGIKTKRDTDIIAIKEKVNEIGKTNIKAIIAYNYAPIAFYKLYRYCKQEKITLIPDITEWYLIDGNRTFNSVLRVWLTTWRIKYISTKCKNVIVAVDAMAKVFDRSNVLILPQVSELKFGMSGSVSTENNMVKFLFAGYTGINFSKEKVDTIIKAFGVLSEEYSNFQFDIVGIDEATAIRYCKDIESILNENIDTIKLHGRLSNKETIEILKKSDYSIFIRPNNRVSNYGFPGKVKEAFAYGIPIITNDTGDLSNYIKHKVNGFLFSEGSLEDTTIGLKEVLSLSVTQRQQIRKNCENNNPFYQDNFLKDTKSFLDKI